MILTKLIQLANKLDQKHLFAEAEVLDGLIKKLAMSLEEARVLLGVSSAATEDEIQKAFKQKALENHPDRGGDLEKMKAVNIARDLLLGERPQERPTYTPAGSEKMRVDQETGQSFEEAVSKASIPAEVEWKFVTSTQHGSHGFDTNLAGWVAYGATKNEHVFVGVYHTRTQNAFTHQNLSDYQVQVRIAPKSEPLAAVGPNVIRELWSHFPGIKQYNAKVSLLDPGATLKPFMRGGRTVAFKDAVGLMGEAVPDAWKGKKSTLLFTLTRGAGLINPNIVLVYNGREFPLSAESNNWAWSTRPTLPNYIIGEYAYEDSKKELTRMDKAKATKALEVMIKRLEAWEPAELIEALKQTLEQIQGK